MSIVRIEEVIQPLKYLVVTQEKDPESVVTTNIILTDNRLNKVNLVAIEKGPQGEVGPSGAPGPPGQNGISFDILSVSSGGTNNTSFTSGNIIYFDGDKLSSSNYTFDDIINLSNPNAITGILPGSGTYKISNNNTAEIGINVGDGLVINNTNQIVVDDTIVRKVELDLGSIDGLVPIAKGGTNSQAFTSNRLLYYNGTQITSFPLSTGRILLSGTTIDIIAGSGLTGGGTLTLPSGSVVLNIGDSSDILVETNSISLSTTGTAGTYSKITTDVKGRVVSGSNLSQSDILNILGYTPWNPDNDGENSGLDADLLDGLDSPFFLNLANHTGTLDANSLPLQGSPGTFTKVQVNNKGIVINGLNSNYFDIIDALGFIPVNTTGDTITGPLTVNGDVVLNGDNLTIKDNLPMIGTNSQAILPSEPRGFSFMYGGYTEKTGILAYYPAEQQLRLVTNITTNTGIIDGGGSGDPFMDDIDGGDQNSIYIVGSLTGNANIVLFKSVADSLYISRINNQAVSGIKTFVNGLIVNNQISIIPDLGQNTPPIFVGSNTNMVENLNVDLLHGENKDFYNNAFNMTGLFSYEKVQFDNLEGTTNYLPRFDARTSDPTRTISNSIVRQKQDGSAIIVENNANLFIGSTNSGSFLANRSISAGLDNKVYQDNSLSIGVNTIISGENSIAFNSNTKTFKRNSIAAGNYGYTWAENQNSFGTFAEVSGSLNLAQGQYSTIGLALSGYQTNGSWVSMYPSIVIPKNKTIAYNLQVLMNKSAGTGAALISYHSGIIKNTTYRDPNNLTQTQNISSELRNSNKNEIYNDSQYRDHYYHYSLENGNPVIQNLSVTRMPLNYTPISTQNTLSVYEYTPEYESLSGTFYKTNDGYSLFKLDKPIASGWFTKNSGSYKINIKAYDHKMSIGCMVNLNFTSGNIYRPHSKLYEVTEIIDNDNFSVNELAWDAWLTNDDIYFDSSILSGVNASNSPEVIGTITTNSPTIYNITPSPLGIFSSGMFVEIAPLSGLYPEDVMNISGLISRHTISGVTNNSIILSSPYTGIYNNNTVNCSAVCKLILYSEYHLNNTNIFQVYIPGSGYGPVRKIIQNIPQPSNICDNVSGITVSGISTLYDKKAITITPAIQNSGFVNLITRRNSSGVFIRDNTNFEKYNCIYVQYPSISGQSITRIYNQELENMDLPSAPFEYSLSCKYGGTDNSKFSISGNKLYANNYLTIDNPYYIKISSTDRSGRVFEKHYTIESGSIDEFNQYDIVSTSFNINNILLKYDIQSPLNSGEYIGEIRTLGGYSPFVQFNSASNSFSGILTSGSNIITEYSPILNTGYPTANLSGSAYFLATGNLLFSEINNYNFSGTITGINGNNILLDTIYSGISSTGIVSYFPNVPSGSQYYPTDLFSYSSGLYNIIKGFEFTNTGYVVNTGVYATGIATVYTNNGYSRISIRPTKNLNLDTGENSALIRFSSSNQALPQDDNYPVLSGNLTSESFYIRNAYLYPDSGIYSTGLCSINIDKNHGYEILDSSLINQIPVQFNSVQYSNTNRLPKNNLFDILAITGNTISVLDNKNYLLNETSKPTHFEQPINGIYRTNGFIFSGIVQSGYNIIYNCVTGTTAINNSQIFSNTYIGSYNFGEQLITRSQPTITFSGILTENSNIIQCTGLGLSSAIFYPGMLIYTTTTGITFFPNNTIISSTISGQTGTMQVSNSIFGLPGGVSQTIALSVLPSFEVEKNFILNNKTSEITKFYFNGNEIIIDQISTPKSYLNVNDQIKILNFNNTPFQEPVNPSLLNKINRYARITGVIDIPTPCLSGISTNIYPFGHVNLNSLLPNTGFVSFVGSCSGYCTIPKYNNLYHHTYGGTTSYWPRDNSGKIVPYPITGVYFIGNTECSSCSSGTLCVTIKGFSNTNFNQILDTIDRSSIGKNINMISGDNTIGYIRPWGVNKKFYFDFTDGCSGANGIYYIVDKIDPTTITINIPYNINYLNASGLVYIIDSDENIKSNLNPNLNNSFISPSDAISIPNNSNLYDYSIKTFNNSTKRWKNLVHLNNENISYSGYDVSFNQSVSAKLLAISPDNININNLLYSTDGTTYTSVQNGDPLYIDSTKHTIYFRATVSEGARKWSNSVPPSAPKINIFGIADYAIDIENITYNYTNKTWSIDIIANNINLIYQNHNITITASDESGSFDFDLYLTTRVIPTILPSNTAYTYQNGDNWILSYNIKNLPPSSVIVMSGYPGISYSVSDEQLLNSSGQKIVTGPPGAVAGTYYPVLAVKDLVTDELLDYRSSTITVLALNQSMPAYTIQPMGLDDDIYIRFTDLLLTNSFDFYIPAIDDAETNLVVTFESDPNYTITPVIEYSTYSQRYRVTANVTGVLGYYSYKNVNISLNQPYLDENDEIQWSNHTLNKSVSFTLYKDIQVSKNIAIEPIVSSIEQPWSIQFNVTRGIGSHRPDLPPKVRLSNLPTIGTYETQPMEYNISYIYDTGNRRWGIFANGKPDFFQKYAYGTGLHQIKIYAEDQLSNATENISLLFNRTTYLDNIQSKIYSTPNNSFQSNIDIKNTNSITIPPTVAVPEELKENTIVNTKYYGKYDGQIDIWEYAYSGNPITEKWDADIVLSNFGSPLGNDTYSTMNVRCKGIASDKIYAVGKLDIIELDSSFVPGLPLTITGIQTPYYTATEGNKWKIEFETIGGLENPNYPPTIIFSGLPSPCSGYNPKISQEQQNVCFLSRSWNGTAKKWSFEFEGLPICSINGLKPFVITAIDTDTTQNLFYGSDTKTANIFYQSLIDIGSDHPSPQVIPASNLTPSTIPLYPLCNNTAIDIYYKFGPRFRELCPAPTGITGWKIDGSLPSGLSYDISFPGGNPSPPWSNIGSGTLRITGIPLAFSNGGLYSQKLRLTVYDARGKSGTKEIQFTDASTPNDPSPINLTVFFDNEQYVYTQRSSAPNSPSGSAKIDELSSPSVTVLAPPAENVALDCYSILPHNKCSTSTFVYDGGDYNGGNINVKISETRMTINNGDKIFVEFNDDPANEFNGDYTIFASGGNNYIPIPGQFFDTGNGRLVLQKISSFATNNLQKYNGTFNTSTLNSILGCGSIKYVNNEYGLYGRIHPTFMATIPVSGSFKFNDVFLTGLNISKIPEYNSETGIFSVKTSNCWETGYLRISGIYLPKPTIELTNPPPAFDLAPFSYNNQAYSVLSRCVYGNSPYEKDLSNNYRTINVSYILSNITSKTITSNGTVVTLEPGVGNGQAIQFNNTLNSGAVFSIRLQNTPDIFPTYRYNAIPFTKNEYFWVHKAGSRETTPTQASFPPIVVTGLQDYINCQSGIPISTSGFAFRAIGGYIPYIGVDQQVPFYKLADNSIWNLIDYPPTITGILQSQLNKLPVTGTYIHSGLNYTTMRITIPSGFYNLNDLAYLEFPDSIISNTGITWNTNLNYIDIPLVRSGPQATGYVVANSNIYITNSSGNYISFYHNDIPFTTGDYVDVVDRINTSISTEFNKLPETEKLSIYSGNNNYMTLYYAGTGNIYDIINTSGYYNIRKNYYDQLYVHDLTYVKDGEWRFALSGTTNGLYKDYIYKTISIENTGLPIFSGTQLFPKKYSVEYPLYVQKPIQVILPQSVIDNGITNSNGSWSLTFNIDGGKRPVESFTPEIYVNNSLCNFTRVLSISGMKDQYNSSLDQLSVTITSVNNPANYDWKNIQSFDLKIEDETGFDTETINMNQP